MTGRYASLACVCRGDQDDPDCPVHSFVSWADSVPGLIDSIRDGDLTTRALARAALKRMAMAADRYISIAETGLVDTDVLTKEGLEP